MKSFLRVLLLIFSIPFTLQAQELNLYASMNTGFYSFRGDGSASVSRINGTSYTNNPYGSKGGLSYGLSLNLKRVTKGHFVFGADFGYELLRSKVDLDYMDVIGDIASSFQGKTYLNTSFINLFPYFGRRIEVSKQTLNLVAGLDVGYILSAREKGEANSVDNTGFEITTSRDRKNIKTDLRPRVQLSVDLDKIGLYLGYSHGLRNYKANYVGISAQAYSRMWRAGLFYRLNRPNFKKNEI